MPNLQAVLAKSIGLLPELKFDSDHVWHRGMVCLYCSIIEYADTVVLLEQQGKSSGIPGIVRSLLEAYVDLYNLSQDPNYGYGLEISYRREWLKIANEAETGKNPYLQGMASVAEFSTQQAQWQAEIDKLKGKGYRELNKEEKFAKAGMTHEYKSIYNFLCAESHNNMRALIGRHIEIEGTPPKLKIVALSPMGDDEKTDILMAANYLSKASKLIHDILKTGHGQKF